MKKIFYILMLTLLPLWAVAEVEHTPGVFVAGGYEGLLLPDGSSAHHGVGGQGVLGVDYTLRAGHFLMNIGVGGAYSRVGVNAGSFESRLPHSVDLDGFDFTFVYDVRSRLDAYDAVTLQVPLLFGAEFGMFRFLVGGKLLYSGQFAVSQQLHFSSYGLYDAFLDPFVSMPEHQFYDNATRSDRMNLFEADAPYKQQMTIDAAVSAELGLRLTPEYNKGKAMIWLSLYADCGVLPHVVYDDHSAEPLVLPEKFKDEGDYMISAPVLAPVLGSNAVAEGLMRHLAVGLKLSVGFPVVSRARRSGPCHCLDY